MLTLRIPLDCGYFNKISAGESKNIYIYIYIGSGSESETALVHMICFYGSDIDPRCPTHLKTYLCCLTLSYILSPGKLQAGTKPEICVSH